MPSSGAVVAGIDLGGTNLRLGIVATNGDVRGFTSEHTIPTHGGAAVVERMTYVIRGCLAVNQLSAGLG